MRRIGIEERRARLAIRHRLAVPAADPVQAAAGVLALHATDPATVFLSVAARSPGADVATVEDALYRQRALVRMLGMRRTMFVVPTAVAPVIQAACARAVAEQQWRLYSRFVAEAGLGDRAWLADVVDGAERALVARGEASAALLSTDEPRLRSQVQMAEGKAYGRRQNITTWVLFLLAAEGRIVRGRPAGAWTSTQWCWTPMDAWLPGGMPDLPVPQARADLARRWLAAFGPGTVADLRWWTGWTATQVRQVLAEVAPVEVDLDGQPGLVLAEDLEPVPAPEPWVALLPALDATPMGWSGRDWFLGPHAAALFDRSGNVGPTVWCDGRIVGGWAQRADGEVVYRLLEDVGTHAETAVAQRAAQLAAWVRPVRVVPRFRTPLERELCGG